LTGNPEVIRSSVGLVPTNALVLIELGPNFPAGRIRLGRKSLDVTRAYLKGKASESVEAQEHANGSSLALYA